MENSNNEPSNDLEGAARRLIAAYNSYRQHTAPRRAPRPPPPPSRIRAVLHMNEEASTPPEVVYFPMLSQPPTPQAPRQFAGASTSQNAGNLEFHTVPIIAGPFPIIQLPVKYQGKSTPMILGPFQLEKILFEPGEIPTHRVPYIPTTENVPLCPVNFHTSTGEPGANGPFPGYALLVPVPFGAIPAVEIFVLPSSTMYFLLYQHGYLLPPKSNLLNDGREESPSPPPRPLPVVAEEPREYPTTTGLRFEKQSPARPLGSYVVYEQTRGGKRKSRRRGRGQAQANPLGDQSPAPKPPLVPLAVTTPETAPKKLEKAKRRGLGGIPVQKMPLLQPIRVGPDVQVIPENAEPPENQNFLGNLSELKEKIQEMAESFKKKHSDRCKCLRNNNVEARTKLQEDDNQKTTYSEALHNWNKKRESHETFQRQQDDSFLSGEPPSLLDTWLGEGIAYDSDEDLRTPAIIPQVVDRFDQLRALDQEEKKKKRKKK